MSQEDFKNHSSPYEKLGVSKNASAWEILGIPKGSSEDDAKKARNSLMRDFHPDQQKGDEKVAMLLNDALDRIREGSADTDPAHTASPETSDPETEKLTPYESCVEVLKMYKETAEADGLSSEESILSDLIGFADKDVLELFPHKTEDELIDERIKILAEIGITIKKITEEESDLEFEQILQENPEDPDPFDKELKDDQDILSFLERNIQETRDTLSSFDPKPKTKRVKKKGRFFNLFRRK